MKPEIHNPLRGVSICIEYQPSPISLWWYSNFCRQADAVFTVSSGNREKILFILLILSEKKLNKNPFLNDIRYNLRNLS